MSTMARLTLIGLYEYEQTFERDLFRNLQLPDGYVKADFVNALLLEHGEKCVLYTNPEFFAQAIGIWSNKWAANLERIHAALTEEYNPLYNFDRHEEYSDNEGRKHEITTNAGHKAADSPDFTVVNETNQDATTEHTISADNSSTYQPEWKETQNGGKNTATTKGKTQDLSETSNSTTKDNETHNFTHKGHLYGNIGVTTSTQMLTAEVDARMKYNLYEAAGRLFANELLIGIY